MKNLFSIGWRAASVLLFGLSGVSLSAISCASAQTQPQSPAVTHSEPDIRSQLKDTMARRQLLLSSLLGRLKQSTNPDNARVLEGAIWKVWLRSGSPTIDLLMGQVTRSMARVDYTLSLKLLDYIVELAPGFPEGWNKRATVLYILGKYQASLDDIEHVLELEPRHFGALSGMGLVLQKLGDKKGALNAFRRALILHPFLPAAKQGVKILQQEVEGQGI